jgi:hypothetical protein
MKIDTTTWILLAALFLFLLWEWNKKQQAAGSLSGGYLPGTPGAAGAAGKTSLLQQLFGPPKQSAGGGGGGGLSAGSAGKPSAATPISKLMAPGPVPPLDTLAPYTALIPSVPPPIYNMPGVTYGSGPQLATIPESTDNLFLTPTQPPSYESTTTQWTDSSGNPIDITGGDGPILQGTSVPSYNIPAVDYPGIGSDQTYFSPANDQTINTDQSGMMYQDNGGLAIDSSSGGDFSYDPGGYTGGMLDS